MHLVSRVAQTVTITAARTAVTFLPGERIWTESSYKYEPDRIERLGTDTGFAMRRQWLEPEARFALSLFAAV
jgi:L-histidine Nalpha-methyltransferase